jgi:ectoine hydroxylase-related dioxygenase (phytanoyl-CoA dioxygenase family)
MGTEISQLRAEYDEQGFVVARGLLDPSLVDNCLDELRAFLADQAAKMGRTSSDDLDALIRSVMVPGTPERSFIYDNARCLASVRHLEARPEIQETLHELGLELPICFEIPSIRFDFPEESEFLTKAHQDVRSIRSSRCITIWTPLRRADAEHGTVSVYPGTHRLGLVDFAVGAEENVKVGDDYLAADPVPVEAGPGDVVFMNSFVIHESHPNSSDKIKLNVQAFYNDALGMTMGDEFQALAALPDYKELRAREAQRG